MAAGDTGGIVFGKLASPELRSAIARAVHAVPADFGGGSGLAKALVMADLILAHQLDTYVEIGVYRGRSLVGPAIALMELRRGKAYGIDPWSASEAVQQDDHGVGDEINAWVRQVDWDAIYADVERMLVHLRAEDYVELIRSTSREAADRFPPAAVDMLHIDGNHDRSVVEADLELYLPKVRPGGFVILDDVSWASVRPSYQQLREDHELVFELHDRAVRYDDSEANDWAAFRVRPQSS